MTIRFLVPQLRQGVCMTRGLGAAFVAMLLHS